MFGILLVSLVKVSFLFTFIKRITEYSTFWVLDMYSHVKISLHIYSRIEMKSWFSARITGDWIDLDCKPQVPINHNDCIIKNSLNDPFRTINYILHRIREL